MAEFTLTREEHDATICTEIGAAAGQTDWPIEHRNEGNNVILRLPDGVLDKAQFDAVVAAHVPPVVLTPVDKDAQLVTALQAASTVAGLKAALLTRFGG